MPPEIEGGEMQENQPMTSLPATQINSALTPVWREVARAIADAGARRCFGLVGGANFKVTLALSSAWGHATPRAEGCLMTAGGTKVVIVV